MINKIMSQQLRQTHRDVLVSKIKKKIKNILKKKNKKKRKEKNRMLYFGGAKGNEMSERYTARYISEDIILLMRIIYTLHFGIILELFSLPELWDVFSVIKYVFLQYDYWAQILTM